MRSRGSIADDDFDLADDVDMDVRVKLGDGSECVFSSRHAKYLLNFLAHAAAGGTGTEGPLRSAATAGAAPTSGVWSASYAAAAAVGSFASSFASASSSVGTNRTANSSLHNASAVAIGCGTRQTADLLNEFYHARDSQQKEVLLRKLRGSPPVTLQVLELCHALECTELFLAAGKVFGDIIQQTVQGLASCGAYPPTTTDHLQKCSSTLQRTFGLPDEMESQVRLKELASYYDPKLPLQSQLTHSVSPEVFAQMRLQAAQRQAQSVNDDNFAQKVLNLDPFRQRVWQPDAEATHCPGNKSSGPCGKAFPTSYNFMWSGVTAEHCRCCGLRKCSSCTSYLVDRSIARVVKPGSNDSENTSQQRPACKDCYLQALELTKYLFLSRAFVFAQLHVPLINLMRCVNKQWRSAAELCLNEYRNRFYFHATVGSEISREFSEIIRNTSSLMAGHPLLVHMYFYVMDWCKPEEVRTGCDLLEKTLLILADRGKRFPPHSHWQLLCTRECAVTSREVFALQILFSLQRVPPRYAVQPTASSAVQKDRGGTASKAGDAAGGVDENEVASQFVCLSRIHAMLIEALSSLDGIHMCSAMTQLLLDVATVTPCQPVCVPVLYEWVRKFQWIGTVLIQEVSSRPRNPTLQWLSTCPENSRVPRQDDRLLQSIPADRQAPFVMSMKVLEALVHAFSKKKPADAAEAQRVLLKQLVAHGVVVGGDAVRVGEPLSSGVITGLYRFTFFFDARAGSDIVGVKLGDVVVASSQAMPVIIPFIDMHGKTRRVMYKGENLRKDFVVCTGAAILQDLVAEANPQDKDVRSIPRYRVLPLTADSGLVEMVEECLTVQDVIRAAGGSGGSSTQQHRGSSTSSSRSGSGGGDKKPLLALLKGPIAQHIKLMQQTSATSASSAVPAGPHHHHPHTHGAGGSMTPIQQVSHNFLLSARFFILINYVFAIGDRHRDNVMVSLRDGCIFHIDFGMIMNTKTLAESLTSQYVRFDQDIVECIEALTASSSSAPPSAAAESHRDPNQSPAPHPSEAMTAQEAALARREKAVKDFLSTTGDWFISVRPHSSILFLLLGHLVRHRVLGDNKNAASSAISSSSTATGTTQHPAGSSTIASDEQLLSRELRSIFVAGCTESEARRIFIDRVSESVGKNWLKDLTYETRKRAKSIYADITSALWSYWSPGGGHAVDDGGGNASLPGSSTAFQSQDKL